MEDRIKSLEEAFEYYKLTQEEHEQIGKHINEIMMFGKKPEENPIAVIDIAPPGSGKTGLNGYALKQFPNGNLIIVNNDEFKPFHPKADEIAQKYPEYYIKVTNEESKRWTDELVDTAIEGKYNLLYEGTGRKITIFQRMIEQMRKQGYKIIVRAMVVNELNCLMSIVERYEGQVAEKGWGRLVSAKTFYKAYDEEMLNTLNTFEATDLADVVEVYVRGDNPAEPIRIYGDKSREYKDARTAVVEGRNQDRRRAIQYYEQVFSKAMKNYRNTEEEQELIEKIEGLYRETKDRDEGVER